MRLYSREGESKKRGKGGAEKERVKQKREEDEARRGREGRKRVTPVHYFCKFDC